MARSRLLICFVSACISVGVLGLAPPAHAADVECNGTFGAVTIDGNVIVPPGAKCILNGTSVTGNVLFGQASVLVTQDAIVAGNISGEGANRINIYNTTVTNIQLKKVIYRIVIADTRDQECQSDPLVLGRIQLEENSAMIMICRMSTREDVQLTKNTGPIGLWDNIIGEDLQLADNTQSIGAHRNMVGENIEVIKNTGGVTLNANSAGMRIQCADNAPPPTGVGNTAPFKEGQCAGL